MKARRWKLIVAVIPDPFARRQIAATKAVAIAQRCGARLVFFNAFMVPQPVSDVPMDSSEEILESAIQQRVALLEALAKRLRAPRGTRCIVRWDYPQHEAIVRQVLHSKPDLLVTESHRHGRLARLLLANTDWQLMRDCPCPLWFVRSASLPKTPQVLVAVDPRHAHAKPAQLDDRLLLAARTLTHQLGGRTAIVHAYDPPLSAPPGMLMEPVRLPLSPERTRQFVAKTSALVSKLAGRYRIASRDQIVEQGSPHSVIAAQARRRRCDVLMMGAVSRSLLTRPVIGNTAERVIDQADCDVFVVKPAGFRSPVRSTLVRRAGEPLRIVAHSRERPMLRESL